MHDPDDAPSFEWNDIYTGTSEDYQAPDAQLLASIDALGPGEGRRALDVGCGAGGLVAALVERGFNVTGVDIAPNAIASAKALLKERGLEAKLEVADAAGWQPAERYHLITSSFALPNTKAGQATLFATMKDALEPGGTLLLKDFDATMGDTPQFKGFHCPSLEELRAAFEGLELLKAELVEVRGHGGSAPDAPPMSAAFVHAQRAAQ